MCLFNLIRKLQVNKALLPSKFLQKICVSPVFKNLAINWSVARSRARFEMESDSNRGVVRETRLVEVSGVLLNSVAHLCQREQVRWNGRKTSIQYDAYVPFSIVSRRRGRLNLSEFLQ